MRPLLRLLKGLYDLLATYLLAWVLLFALLAGAFYAGTSVLTGLAGFESVESFWIVLGRKIGGAALALRLVLFVALHAFVLWRMRHRLRASGAWVERRADAALARYRRWSRAHRDARIALGLLFTLAVTGLLVPFVLQPTLVPLRFGPAAWAQRAANLVDGTASAALLDSAVGLYRRLVAQPVPTRAVRADQYDQPPPRGAGAGALPLMDRWDPLIARTVAGDRRAFALVKAVMWVESAGRQFAVSSTGCAGLMQFCSRTARSATYRPIFGVGQVYPCSCNGVCRVPRALRRELEIAPDAAQLSRLAASFPCVLSDARFDGAKSIAAGWRFLDRLQRELGGNLHLTYIAYNSGPEVARRLARQLGPGTATADLQALAPLLPAALRPYYGGRAHARAQSLLRVHLPKLQRAFLAYQRSNVPLTASSTGAF